MWFFGCLGGSKGMGHYLWNEDLNQIGKLQECGEIDGRYPPKGENLRFKARWLRGRITRFWRSGTAPGTIATDRIRHSLRGVFELKTR